MSEPYDTQSQICAGLFKRSVSKYLCKLFIKYNNEIVFNILENIVGMNGITIHKPRSAGGRGWVISGSGTTPEGYEEETVNIVTDAGIVTRTILVKTETKASVESFSSSDSRLLLSVNSDGVVRKSKGYLKS